MADQQVISQLYFIDQEGKLSEDPIDISANAENIVYVDKRHEGEQPKYYRLSTLLDTFMDFLETGNFVYASPQKPDNPQIKLWIKTENK